MAAAYLAQWMLPTAAQWFLVSSPGDESLVPIVQVAMTLPMAVLAIPAGVLADRMDRRRIVIAVQLAVLVIETTLVVSALTGALRPWSMLALLAVLACGIVVTFISLSSMVPDLVPTEAIPAASALLTIATNATRVIGPALAGAILAVGSVGAAFAASIPATALLLVVLARMASPGRPTDRAHESWMSSAASGIRFVRHSPQALKLLLRSFWFTTAIMGLLSLLPLLAIRLEATSAQLGLVLATQGLGAVFGALTLPRLARVALPNRIVAIGFLMAAVAVGLAAKAPNLVLLGIATVFAGWAWTTVLATVQAGMQMYLPAWVRARGLSILMIATFAGQALGAFLLGWAAGALTLTWALTIAAVVLFGGAMLACVFPLRDLHDLDRSAADGWLSPEIVVTPSDTTRHLQVRLRYDVAPEAQAQFIETMASLRRIRLRTGALRWHLLEDSEVTGRFYEEFAVASWSEHEQQVRWRVVASDLAVETRARSLAAGEPSISYAFRVVTGSGRTAPVPSPHNSSGDSR